MNKLVPITVLPPANPSEERLVNQCRKALLAQAGFAYEALIAGQMLFEHRAAVFGQNPNVPPSCHSGKTGQQKDGENGRYLEKSDGDKFCEWLEGHGVPSRTAYRWMAVAERVSRRLLGLRLDQVFSPVIEIEGAQVSLSMALTAPEKELPDKALQFRQAVFDFMQDKTLKAALEACMDGDSDPKRVTLAAGGKLARGAGGSGNRKAFEEFTRRKLGNISTFLEHKLSAGQKGEIVAAFNRALESWPRWIVEALAEKSRAELKLSDQQRGNRKLF